MDWQRVRDDILNKLDLAERELSGEDYENLLGDLQTEIDGRINCINES